MRYEHTQNAPLYLILVAVGVGMFMAAGLVPEPVGQSIFAICGAMMFLLACCFHHLTISDEGDQLLIHFGPIPLFRRRVTYSEIEKVQQARSTIWDGWGIHLSPGGGWTWNLWGFDCVDVWHRKGGRLKKVRIGTDDPVGLQAFLIERLSMPEA